MASHPDLAFRRTVRTHAVVDADAAEVASLGADELDELPHAATLDF